MPSNGDQNRSPPIGAALSASRVLGPPPSRGVGHKSPIFTSGLLVQCHCCEHTGPLRLVHGFPNARTTTGPPSHSVSVDRRQIFPATHDSPSHQQGPTEWFPRSLSNPSTGSVPSYAPATSPPLLRSRSPWPPGPTTSADQGVSRPAQGVSAGTRCNPARICQVGAGGAILRGFRPLVPHVHLLVSLAGPTPSDSAGMSRRCRGCFRLHRCPPDRVAPSFNRSAATDRWQWSFTTAGF